ncbi:MAG TPA: AarF/UbiB family protein [Microbacterium sp.]|nr:AarF/UbiB family protein [Microbacterium sp.]
MALDILIVLAATVVTMILIGSLSRRLLGVRVGTVRIVIAGLLGLGAEIGFESQYVWENTAYSPVLIPIQFAIIFFTAVAFLVVAELVVPQGSVSRPDQWLPGIRRTFDRASRYSQLTRIAARHKLIPFTIDTAQTPAAERERTREAQSLANALEEAGGAFVKIGQLLSTRSDILPPEFTAALGALQQEVPPAPWDEIATVIDGALPGPRPTVFAELQEKPLASASIGQVHLGVLVSGERVAVKARRPGIAVLIERDADIALRLSRRLAESSAWARRIGLEGLATSLTDGLRDEVDYRVEARNMAALEAAMNALPEQSRIRIPRHMAQLCTEDVLVMEFLDGQTLAGSSPLAAFDDATRQVMATRLLRSTLAQIMDVGVFHSDLHPGNVLITPEGELALLDFGSVGRLDSTVRVQITDVLLAFSRSDARAFADALLAFIDIPDDLDEFALRQQIGAFMARYLGPGFTLDTATFTEVMSILAEFGLAAPPELTVPFRTIATVEGALRVIDPSFDFIAEATRYAEARTSAARQPFAIADAVKDELLSVLPLVRKLPQRIDSISGSLASGRLNVNVRLLADRRDRRVLQDFVNLAAVAFLAGVFGIMAAMLLTSTTGPVVTPTLTLFQIFGYLLLVVSGVLALRVFFDTFRRR